ncbi:hypothetical protein EGW08_007316 [Elysia chlorotica]|uniref:Uncharacterized protein n=1 Tax=Elysia chlorotica TaxID=188477 RepID=A0A433TTM8_ELYCH|nr:hypothetical protein EGW08_007316 [Elysia chlorotica]
MACCRLKLLLWRILQLMAVLMMLLLLLMVDEVESQVDAVSVSPFVNQGSPHISDKPRNQTAYNGARVSLTCEAQAFPQNVHYSWFRGDLDLETTNAYRTNRYTISQNGQLVIKSYLTLPYLTLSYLTLPYLILSHIFIPCVSPGSARTDSWISQNGQLVIKPLFKQDHGWYRCRATNSMGFDEATAFVDVLFILPPPPFFHHFMSRDTPLPSGYTGQLDCPADANPPINNVKWQKNQDLLASRGRFDILRNGTLLVTDHLVRLRPVMSTCAYNELGAGVQSPRIHVQVKDPPFFVASPDVLYVRNVGDTVRIPCEATGLPRVDIQWIKVGGTLDRTSGRVSISNSYLEISNLIKEDHGRYECRAINNIATVVKVTNLRIDSHAPFNLTVIPGTFNVTVTWEPAHDGGTTPHAPFNLTVIPGTFNVTVTWEPAHDGGTAQQYTLWFRRRNQLSWNHMKVSPPSATHNRLYSLQPETEYEFRVVSTNALGNSSFSETVTQRTLGFDPDTVNSLPTHANGTPYYPHVMQNIGIPPTPPQNLTARIRGKQIELRWDSPIHSPVQFFTFQIEYLRNMRWVRLDKVIEGEAARGAVFNIMGSGTYQLRLLACGTLACSDGSNIVTVTVPDDDLVLSEALVGGIVGGVLFLLVAILLALLAIFHSRKKDRKSKAKKYKILSLLLACLSVAASERTAQWDRWAQHHGGGDVVTSLSNTDSIFFTPQSRDVHDRQHLQQLQQQQHQHDHHHPHHHQQDHHHQFQHHRHEHQQLQQQQERDNPHFYHYSQQQQQQRPKFVVTAAAGRNEDGPGDVRDIADFAGGAKGGNRNREPPDKNFSADREAWAFDSDQHRPLGLVPFSEERRSKKKSKKNKKTELPSGNSYVSARVNGPESYYPAGGNASASYRRAGDRNSNRHESSFQSDLSQAGSFISRPFNGEMCLRPDLAPKLDNDSSGNDRLLGNRNAYDEQEIPPHNHDSYPMDGDRAGGGALGNRPELAQGERPGDFNGNTSRDHLPSSQIPPYGQRPPWQYNNNSFNDSREEKIWPQQQKMSQSSSSLMSRPPHHTSGHSIEPQFSHGSQNHNHRQPFQQSALDSTGGQANSNNYVPSLTDSRQARSGLHNSSDNHSRTQQDQGYEPNDDTEDNVFWSPPNPSGTSGTSGRLTNPRHDHPGLPRHSSMKPGHKMTYLTDDGDFPQTGGPDIDNPSRSSEPAGLFGLQDISSVLEPESEQPSQVVLPPPNFETPTPSPSSRGGGFSRTHSETNTGRDSQDSQDSQDTQEKTATTALSEMETPL